jgi:hypothetical protein
MEMAQLVRLGDLYGIVKIEEVDPDVDECKRTMLYQEIQRQKYGDTPCENHVSE